MQFDFTDVYLYMTSEGKKASNMQATGKGYISAKLLSLGQERLYFWSLNYAFMCECVGGGGWRVCFIANVLHNDSLNIC